jgi:multiple sugar transport system substrate-binding protein
MSNQRHDRVAKEELFAQFSESDASLLPDGRRIQVQMNIFADEYADQLLLAFQSGTPPDIYNMNQARIEVANGWAEPADAWLAENPDIASSFLPGAFVPNRGIYGGQSYGLPMYAQTMRLYYNRRIFEEAGLDPNHPPATYSEFRQFAQQITENVPGTYGLIFGDKFPWVWWMNCTVPAMGAGSYYFDFATGRYNFNQPGIQQAMQLLLDMKSDGSITPGTTTLTDDDARQQFSFGTAGMIIGGSWNPGVFNDQFQSTEDWETAELPFPDSGPAGRFVQGIGDRYTVSAASQNKEAAWQVMRYFYSVPIMTEMYTRGMGVMGVAAANTGQSDVRGVPKLAPTANDVILPPEPELPTQTPDYQTVLSQIFAGDLDMATGLQQITDQYNASLDAEIASGAIVAEDYIVPDFDPLTWQPGGGDATPGATPAA